jgi:hypothetical protein
VTADIEAPPRLTLGSTFGMAMKRGIRYSVVNTVVEFEEGRRIGWVPKARKAGERGRVWRYELEPADGGTRVRETWDISRESYAFLLRPVAKRVRSDMERSLERLEGVVS